MTSWTRRQFLAHSAAAAAAPVWTRAAAAQDGEVVIVGAGAAGIAAARRLASAGVRFTLVEATDHVGGRCVTDTTTFRMPFDRGAHWIYGPDTNPLMKLAGPSGLNVYAAPSSQRVRIGRRHAREGELEDFLSAIVRSNRAIREAARGKTDVSCAQALPRDLGDWRRSVEFALGPYGCARDLAEVSAMDYARSAERDTSAFCRQGYGALLSKLAESIPVELNAPVTRIDTSRGARVEVETAKGVVEGRYAIVTVSTGVLAAGDLKVDRGLPKRQLDALSQLKLGSYDHVALDLAGNPLGLQRDDLVFEKADGARTAALLANVSGTTLAVVAVAGRFGRELSAQGEKAMADFAVEWLAGLFGNEVKKSVGRRAATRWNADPWTLGAIATASPGNQSARRVLMEPVRERVLLAGEAVHETLWGTVGGAWLSGERAAEAVLRKLGALKEPEEPKPATRPKAKPRKSRAHG